MRDIMQQPPSIRPAAEPALSSSQTAAHDAPSFAAKAWRIANKSGIVMVFVILFAVLALAVPDFLTSRNMQGLLLSVTLIGSIAPRSPTRWVR